MIGTLKKFNLLLDRGEKRRTAILLLLATAGALFEMLSVSLMVPLMTAILEPSVVTENAAIAQVCRALGITGHRGFIVLCIAAMAAVYVIKALFLLFKNAYTARFVYRSRFAMQQRMLHAFLQKPYEYFLNAQSGEILRTVRTDVQNAYGLLELLLSLISEAVASVAVLAVVVAIDPLMTGLIAAFLSVILLVILALIRPALREEGARWRKNVSRAYGWTLQAIEGIKEIKVGRREAFFEQGFEKAGREQVGSEQRYSVLSRVPRILIELGCVMAGLTAMLVMILSGREPRSLVPAFSAFAMAAVKLMPTFGKVAGCVNAVSYHGPAVDRLLENLAAPAAAGEAPDGGQEDLTLRDRVEFRDITYRYRAGQEPILENASMTVPAGHTVGIVGVSGAGKTTAADLLLGLLTPETGQILCDGVDVREHYGAWLRHVAYIPQSIFMLDGSIRENVVFGNGAAEDDRVWRALEDARLASFVRQLPEGLDTGIGERGIRLSGGQRQRIGIARALYGRPELLVLDEATSSLDTGTEAAIMETIRELQGKKTVIVIAHRPETIRACDTVYRVQERKLTVEK